MTIKTVDLIEISNAAKALKQKEFLLKDCILYGVDNIQNYLIHTNNLFDKLNTEINNVIINTRELSAFIKAITTEEQFELINDINGYFIKTDYGDCILRFIVNINYNNMIANKIIKMSMINFNDIGDVTNDLGRVFEMKKADGVYYYNKIINNISYFMTLFSGLLPLNKADKISLSIADSDLSTFISKFTVLKKKYSIVIYLAYLRV